MLVNVPLKLVALVAPAKPFKSEVPVGSLQVYEVLSGILPDKDGAKGTPLQVVILMLLIAAEGNTDTVAVKPGPAHPLEVGIIKYVPVTTAFVMLVKVPLKLDWLDAADPPLASPVGELQL